MGCHIQYIHLQTAWCAKLQTIQSTNSDTFKDPRNRFQGINSASLQRAGTITLFVLNSLCLKIPAQLKTAESFVRGATTSAIKCIVFYIDNWSVVYTGSVNVNPSLYIPFSMKGDINKFLSVCCCVHLFPGKANCTNWQISIAKKCIKRDFLESSFFQCMVKLTVKVPLLVFTV